MRTNKAEATVRVRSARQSDREAVAALLSEAQLPTDGLDDQFVSGFAVAVEREQVIGAAGIERHGAFGLLRSAVVAPEARGRRVGEAVLQDRIEWSIRAGLEAVYLLTTTAADYFKRYGFHVVDRSIVPDEVKQSKEFASICPSTATVMRLSLSDGALL